MVLSIRLELIVVDRHRHSVPVEPMARNALEKIEAQVRLDLKFPEPVKERALPPSTKDLERQIGIVTNGSHGRVEGPRRALWNLGPPDWRTPTERHIHQQTAEQYKESHLDSGAQLNQVGCPPLSQKQLDVRPLGNVKAKPGDPSRVVSPNDRSPERTARHIVGGADIRSQPLEAREVFEPAAEPTLDKVHEGVPAEEARQLTQPRDSFRRQACCNNAPGAVPLVQCLTQPRKSGSIGIGQAGEQLLNCPISTIIGEFAQAPDKPRLESRRIDEELGNRKARREFGEGNPAGNAPAGQEFSRGRVGPRGDFRKATPVPVP